MVEMRCGGYHALAIPLMTLNKRGREREKERLQGVSILAKTFEPVS